MNDERVRNVSATPVTHHYAYCERCRREWPDTQDACYECTARLAQRTRTEWLLAGTSSALPSASTYADYWLVTLRINLAGEAPRASLCARIGAELGSFFGSKAAGWSGSPEMGWMAWSSDPAGALAMANRFATDVVPRIRELVHADDPPARLRWGTWTDHVILPTNASAVPVVDDALQDRLFDFEVRDIGFVSTPVFEQLRSREGFVAIPVVRRFAHDVYAYRFIGHKEPSAMDHLRQADRTRFVGRTDDLVWLDVAWGLRDVATRRVGVIGPAGSGKTRLLAEWMRRHSDVRRLTATLSIFGSDLSTFAAQLLPDQPDLGTNIAAIADRALARIRRTAVELIVIDDLHWASREVWHVLDRVLAELPARGILVILAARPSAQARVRRFAPNGVLRIPPLPNADLDALIAACGLVGPVADEARQSAHGSPLFVEQFAAWALERGYTGTTPAPRTLTDVIASRIDFIERTRLAELRQMATWRRDAWTRATVARTIESFEAEIGRWLDRLETGDYAEGADVLGYLATLERIQLEILVLRSVMGQPIGIRSGRIAESVERLLLGSAPRILADLRTRALSADSGTLATITRDATRAARAAMNRYEWKLARTFFTFALQLMPEREAEVRGDFNIALAHLEADRLVVDRTSAAATRRALREHPSVGTTHLPLVWLNLAVAMDDCRFLDRAITAAHAIRDYAVASIARGRKRRHAAPGAPLSLPSNNFYQTPAGAGTERNN